MRDATRGIADFLGGLGPPDGPGGVAHAWRLAIAVLVSARHLSPEADRGRAVELALVAGLGTDSCGGLDADNTVHLRALRLELDTAGTSEARLVHALDALLDGRAPVTRDPFLRALGRAVAAGQRAAG